MYNLSNCIIGLIINSFVTGFFPFTNGVVLVLDETSAGWINTKLVEYDAHFPGSIASADWISTELVEYDAHFPGSTASAASNNVLPKYGVVIR